MTQWLIEEACLLALEKVQQEQAPGEPDIAALEANANQVLGL